MKRSGKKCVGKAFLMVKQTLILLREIVITLKEREVAVKLAISIFILEERGKIIVCRRLCNIERSLFREVVIFPFFSPLILDRERDLRNSLAPFFVFLLITYNKGMWKMNVNRTQLKTEHQKRLLCGWNEEILPL